MPMPTEAVVRRAKIRYKFMMHSIGGKSVGYSHEYRGVETMVHGAEEKCFRGRRLALRGHQAKTRRSAEARYLTIQSIGEGRSMRQSVLRASGALITCTC